MRTAFNKITLDAEGVYLDGQLIDGMKIARGVTVNHGGKKTPGPSITLTIYADEVEISDAIKAFAIEQGVPIIEIHGDAAGEG